MTLSSLKVAKTPSKKKTKIKRKRTTENLARPRKATQIKNKVKNGQKSEKKNPILLINKQDFKCLTCSALFTSQNDLIKHYHKEHSSKQDKDGKMKEATKSYSILERNGVQSYKCTTCGRVYDNLRAVKRHFEAHVKDRPFICKQCGRTYRTVSEIIRHGRAHNGLKLNCSYQCGYSTVYLGALKEHEKRHRTEFKYKCGKCDKGFQVRTWYEEHQNIHNGVKPFACNICGLAFHMNRYLTAHRTTVHPQSSELKRYVCMHCSLPCDSRKALTDHLKDHGIIKRFLCDICGKTLCSKEQLKFHNRVHIGEKPYSCSICNKSFTKKCNLKLHELTHTDERTHECLKCGKMYKQRSTLLKHNQKYCRGS
ncbi:zinc finger protein 16-like [Hyposmocoma kahamanoa]|uniref:zinc finger protein 16-like n=1 Tax=Hyposmocoma kahamanoa TaxID=1477025 RepID=UPI000E6D8C37|nr:zinc finger protein 16-like [Hyposmocoma kahamanoa]